MLCDKIIEVGLDISNPIAFYANNELMSILALKYEGICFRACLIKKVVRVIETSDCIINREGMPNFGTISVRFLARVLVYAEGEVINGCQIIQHDATIQTIICQTADASLIISDKLFESATVGQKISIRVGAARYNIGASKISINGVPFIQEPILVVYRFGAGEIPAHNLMIAINDEMAKMKEIRAGPNASHWDVMERLIYAYTTPQETPKGATEIPIDSLVGRAPLAKYISRDPRIGTRDVVYGYASVPVGAILNDQLIGPAAVIAVLQDYYDYIRTVREFTEIYNTPEMIASHRNIWMIYKKAKTVA